MTIILVALLVVSIAATISAIGTAVKAVELIRSLQALDYYWCATHEALMREPLAHNEDTCEVVSIYIRRLPQ